MLLTVPTAKDYRAQETILAPTKLPGQAGRAPLAQRAPLLPAALAKLLHLFVTIVWAVVQAAVLQ